MNRLLVFALLSIATISPGAADSVPPSPPTDEAQPSYPPAPDYSKPAAWACRPGAEDACTANLDAVSIAADGQRAEEPFKADPDAPIDCFYVYPTVSRELQDFADAAPEPAVMTTVRVQAGRLASRCRLYAPLYRQATLAHLMFHRDRKWSGPYDDVQAAWAWYMAHDNNGRGVVLIGHSQGTILLQRLIADRIDGAPDEGKLVAAFLIGDPGLLVPKGQLTGGTFKHVPVCTDAGETGCAYSWGTYLEGDSGAHVFGRNRDGLVAVCTNPAAPGGIGKLDSYLGRAIFAPAAPHDLAAVPGQVEAQCESDDNGSVLRVRVLPGANQATIQATIDSQAITSLPGDWGLHRLDVALTQGSILRLIDAETQSWRRDHH